MEIGLDNLQSSWLRGDNPMRKQYENLIADQQIKKAAEMLEAMFVLFVLFC